MAEINPKAYIITGAVGGIGYATTERLLGAGARVLMVDLCPDALTGASKALDDLGRQAATLALDITQEGSDDRMIDEAITRFGRLDGLVACAGRIRIQPLQRLTRRDWTSTFELNLTSVFFQARAVAEQIKRAGHPGAIVTISATSAHGARPNNADYAASKAGIDNITRTLALEYAPAQIRVNAVSPGAIETSMWRTVLQDRSTLLGLASGELTRRMNASTPLGRIGRPGEIADLIEFLLSARSEYITGQVIEADGGYMLANP